MPKEVLEAYKSLGVSPDVSDSELKKRYRILCRECHPDYHMNLSEEQRAKFESQIKVINDAYHVIVDYRKNHPSESRPSDDIMKDKSDSEFLDFINNIGSINFGIKKALSDRRKKIRNRQNSLKKGPKYKSNQIIFDKYFNQVIFNLQQLYDVRVELIKEDIYSCYDNCFNNAKAGIVIDSDYVNLFKKMFLQVLEDFKYVNDNVAGKCPVNFLNYNTEVLEKDTFLVVNGSYDKMNFLENFGSVVDFDKLERFYDSCLALVFEINGYLVKNDGDKNQSVSVDIISKRRDFYSNSRQL